MCGFAGEFLFRPHGGAAGGTGRPADLDVARKMARQIAHRGPDDYGEQLSPDGRLAVAFHRLAIIDLTGSRQPMVSDDGLVTLCFNGEIYNFLDLRRQLQAAGAVFRSAGDTEVLLQLYRHYGLDMLTHLDGMFAFAIHDAAAGRLVLARDRFGQKPLWYSCLSDRVVFASESRALLQHPGIDTSVCQDSITFYCSMGYIPSPRSAWRGILKLPPASSLVCADSYGTPRSYWAPSPVEVPPGRDAAAHAVRDVLTAAVGSHMQADVPLGALLSGGLDSSIIVGLMAAAAGRTGGVRTFTAGFAEANYDERPTGRLVADHFGTDHTEIVVDPAPADVLDELVAMYGEPFGDSSALATWLICRAAREHVKVALAGDGGDEAFAGYDRYRALQLAETMGVPAYVGARLAAGLVRPFARADERGCLCRFLRFADSLPHPAALRYFMYRRLFSPEDLGRLFTEDFLAGLDPEEPSAWFCDLYEPSELAERPDLGSEVAHAQRHDLATYLPDDLLVKTDIASMAVGLELRAPMLDPAVVRLGLSLPDEMKIRRGRGKDILRHAFSDMLPAAVLAGPKRGFGLPLGKWLREDLAGVLRDTLMDPWLREQGIFRPEALAGLINDHSSGRGDHRHRLWALLVLARWLRQRR
jgi:asparagine synthase (glutamine-hydrolysing)